MDLDLDLKIGLDLDLDLNITGFAHHCFGSNPNMTTPECGTSLLMGKSEIPTAGFFGGPSPILFNF